MTDHNVVAQTILAALRNYPSPWPAGHDVFDGPPTGTPGKAYFCFYDQTGAPGGVKIAGNVRRVRFDFQVSCVARTYEGVRQAVEAARAALHGLVVGVNASPIVEEGSNPILPSGEGNDIRLTAPLTMHCWLPA